MKTKRLFTSIIMMLLSVPILHAQTVTPYFSIRSQGLNTPRHLSGVVQQTFANRAFEDVHGTLAAILEYSRSFDHDEITNCLFGTKECPAITISGSRVANRGTQDWLADYFYLPTDFKSTVSFKPVIDNITLDLNFYLGLDEWAPGLYLTIYAPLVHSRWDLHLCEAIDAKGTNTYDPGYFTPDTMQRNDMLNKFTEYANGDVVNPINQTVGGSDFTVLFQPLQKAKMSSKRRNRTRIADLRVAVGYNFVREDRYQIAFQGLVSAPTGNRPEGIFLFEPIVGNGHHWEVGAGFAGSVTLWQSDDERKQLILFGDANLTHLFKGRQRRTFDLKNKPFSRYMLIEKMGTPITDNLQGNSTAPSAQFKHEFLPVANLSNISVDAKIPLQAEVTACLTFVGNNISWDLGYNFWGRTCEELRLRGLNPFDNNTQWALKGDAHVYGYDRGAAGAGPLVGAIPLSATQSTATIYSGNNFVSPNTVAQAILNPNIDHPRDATGDAANATANHPLSAEPNAASTSIKTSIDPVFLKNTDIDVCERKTSAMSSKLFTHISYTWDEGDDWTPYLGIGGQAEFGHHGNCETTCSTSCERCIRCSLSQWAVWCKGGVTF